MKTRKLLYLILLLAMVFIAISKKSNAATPDNPCKTVIVTCPDGTQASGLVCEDEDLEVLISFFCKIEIDIEVIN